MLKAIGHYQIRRKIGEGAMGTVYEGWDDRLERPVAVKTILEAKESKEARSRLWREARSLARVNHPNVCQVFDVLEEGEALVLILEGQEFNVGTVRLRGTRLCEPCEYLESLTTKGILTGLIHRGGLRASIVSGGTIRIGDSVTESSG